jgi:hypothetical protein
VSKTGGAGMDVDCVVGVPPESKWNVTEAPNEPEGILGGPFCGTEMVTRPKNPTLNGPELKTLMGCWKGMLNV